MLGKSGVALKKPRINLRKDLKHPKQRINGASLSVVPSV